MRHPLFSSFVLGAILIGLSISTHANDRSKPSFREHGDKRVERHQRSDRERSHDRGHSSDRRFADRQRLDKKHRDSRRHHDNRRLDSRHHDKKYRDKRFSHHSRGRDHHRYNNHGRSSSRDRNKYFLGGLILGSLGTSIYSNYDHHYRSGFSNGHRISYWRDRFGDCFRIEHRFRGDVYIQVPRHQCY